MNERKEYQMNILKQCFNDRSVFLECVEKVPNEKLFSDPICRLFWQAYLMIYREGEDLHYSVINDIFKHTNNEELIETFQKTVEGTYHDESQWQYHLSYLKEQFNKELLMELSEQIRKDIGMKSSEELLNEANSLLTDLNAAEVSSIGFKDAFRKAVQNIKEIRAGKTISLLQTGHDRFDDVVSLGLKQILMIAAQKKIGKTRFLVHLMDKLVEHNMNNVAIQWYSFEMQSDEMIRLFLGRKMSLTDKQMLGINYQLTDDQISRMEAMESSFKSYPIDFVDESANIFGIASRFERYADANRGKVPVLVIDNLGLIKPHANNDNQNEDEIARTLKDLRDKTGALIIVLHHLNKESEGKFNITEMYRPKVNHIRGSSRLVDFANKVLLLHRPEFYQDVVKHYAKSGEEYLINGLFEVNCALNRNGDTGIIDFRHDLAYCLFTDFKKV